MKNIIIVPAKGDSKRFLKKNWQKIGDKTLFELALLRAKRSRLGLVVFATDDELMKAKADENFNPIDPSYNSYIIPKELTEKRALDVCLWVLDEWEKEGFEFDNIIVTLPTSPLCTVDQIKEAYELFIRNKRKTLMSFTEIKGRPNLWQDPLNLSLFYPVKDKVYMDNGAIYIDKVKEILRRKEWFEPPVTPFIMDEMTGVDIDTKMDYLTAKFYHDMCNREN